MRIFSTAPEGNEMAELENARYINLALRQIEENVEWLKTANTSIPQHYSLRSTFIY